MALPNSPVPPVNLSAPQPGSRLKAACRRPHAWWRRAAWLALVAMAWAAAPVRAQAPPAPPAGTTPAPAFDVPIPPGALFAATLDLRPENPSLQVLAQQLRPQERAVAEAMVALFGQIGLSDLAAELDLEDDVLPWAGRRVHLVGMPPTTKTRPPRLLVLAEVIDAPRAGQALNRALPKVAESTKAKLFQRPVGDSLLRHLAIPGSGHVQLALGANALAVSRDVGVVEEWLKAPPAAEAPAKWARAVKAVNPGLITVGLDAPTLAGPAGRRLVALGLGAGALALSFSPAGARLEVAADFAGAPAGAPTGQVMAYFSQASLTGEALAAVPATALAAATVASPGGLLRSMGLEPLVIGALGQALGPQSGELMPRLEPVLRRLLGGEIAVALMAAAPRPRWAGVIAAPGGEDLAASLPAIREAVALIPDAKVADGAPGSAGFTVTLPGPPGTVAVAAAGSRLLVASDAEALQWIRESALETGKSLKAAPAYQNVHERLGPSSVLEVFLDPKALARSLSALAREGIIKETHADVPQKYLSRLCDALLLPHPGTGLSLAVRGEVAVATLFQQVDWASASSLAAAAPAVSAIAAAVAIPSFVRAREKAQAATCQSNLKMVGNALLMYMHDNDDRLPPAGNWREALLPYVGGATVLRCPADGADRLSSYAYNSRLSGRPLADFDDPADTITFFETTGTSENPADTGQSLAPRHNGWGNFAFLDGHVKMLPKPRPAQWGPAPPPPAPAAATTPKERTAPAPRPAARQPRTAPRPRR